VASLERLYRKRVSPDTLVQPEIGRQMQKLSVSLNRQIGILVTRGGGITHVIVGDTRGIFLPSLDTHPLGKKALRGLRLIHTHLFSEPVSRDDLTDLSLLRLDALAAIDIGDTELRRVEFAFLTPSGTETGSMDLYHPEEDFTLFLDALEEEMSRRHGFDQDGAGERAILLSICPPSVPRMDQEDSADELRELAQSSDILVLDTVLQRPKKINPKLLMGEGKLRDLVINSMDKGATMLVFDQDLSPSQLKNISRMTELKVIDRSQLILDVFARRAHSRDGKVQVELAQLKYRLPRLTGKGTAMSRLMGGIGGRGPGEMKLEIDRRRVRERIGLLEKQLKSLGLARMQRKQRRVGSGLPIISIIGYTNAGKSTLLNALTGSDTFVEHRMFATLDTASRRLRFPREREVVITDTVGFIRDLPEDLMSAFKATLEELGDADLLLHLVDIANPRFERQMASVERILGELDLLDKTRLLVFNKADLLAPDVAENLVRRFGAVLVSARDRKSFGPLLGALESELWQENLPRTHV
jgi:GTP-binding protein HflX